MKTVDAIVIGSGQGGVPFATRLAEEGKQVVLFERERFGGSCINFGCTPSKALLAAAHAAGRARAAEQLGVRCRVEVDFPQVMERVRSIRDQFSQGVTARLEKAGVRIVRAEASFTPDGGVQGGGQTFSAPLVVIDTGSTAALPPVAGLQGLPYLTDHNFWELQELPRRSLIIGGGYIGLELGQALARLGSEVHILQHGERILSSEDPQVSQVLQTALERDGVRFHLHAELVRAVHEEDHYQLHLQDGHVLEGEILLVATGRRPNTQTLNAAAAGIALDEWGYIKVNDRLESSRPGVYAIGEAAGQPAFTHVSWEDYRRLLAILKGEARRRDDRVLGYAIFTDPQMGRAGLSRAAAEKQGLQVRAARLEITQTARAIEWGQDLGFYEMLVDADTGRILGATLVGAEAAELVHVFIDLIEAGADWELLARAQHIHPTYAEGLPSLARLFQA